MTAVLRVDRLTKRYGDREVVSQVSFDLESGEAVAFLGRNGAGKSTVIKMLCGLVRPSGGTALLDGLPLLKGDVGQRRALGAIVEAPRFYPHLSGRRNLHLVARLLGAEAAVGAMLQRVGLAEQADERVGRYSMGMKQRLGLAAAFVHQPRLVILDEPTGGLDPVGVTQIHELVRALMHDRGAAVLLCTHQLPEAAALCGRALVIDRGHLVLNESLRHSEGIATVQALFDRLALENKAS